MIRWQMLKFLTRPPHLLNLMVCVKLDIIMEGEQTSWISLLAVFCVGVKQESEALGWPLHIQPFGASMAAVQAYLSARLTVRAGVITG